MGFVWQPHSVGQNIVRALTDDASYEGKPLFGRDLSVAPATGFRKFLLCRVDVTFYPRQMLNSAARVAQWNWRVRRNGSKRTEDLDNNLELRRR